MKNILGHSNITNKELPILASTLESFNNSRENTLLELELIDDLLGLQKLTDIQFSFKKAINHKRTYRALLEDRIEKYMEDLELLENSIK